MLSCDSYYSAQCKKLDWYKKNILCICRVYIVDCGAVLKWNSGWDSMHSSKYFNRFIAKLFFLFAYRFDTQNYLISLHRFKAQRNLCAFCVSLRSIGKFWRWMNYVFTTLFIWICRWIDITTNVIQNILSFQNQMNVDCKWAKSVYLNSFVLC